MDCASAANLNPVKPWSCFVPRAASVCSDRDRQDHGRARHRLRVNRREKLTFARKHGADETVNYASERLRGALKRLGGERGVDVSLRSGRRLLCRASRARGARLGEGRYLVVGFAAGEIPKLPPTSCCSRAATSVACSGERGRCANRTASARSITTSVVRRRQAQRARACSLSAGGDCDSAEGHRRPQGHGQNRAEAVSADYPAHACKAHAAPLHGDRV